MTASNLTHLDSKGQARMVDVGDKAATKRQATATATISMQPETMQQVEGKASKGDVLGIARIAGIQAAKKCAELIPLCHPLPLNSVTVDFDLDKTRNEITVTSTCRVDGKTGVEMEALTAVSVAALTIYDMCKAVDRGMEISSVKLLAKSGGKSGDWSRGQ